MATVVLGRFDPLLERGLVDVLRREGACRVVPTDAEADALVSVLMQRSPEVVIMDEAAAGEILSGLCPRNLATRVIVLAREPSLVYRTLVGACGAVCLPFSVSPAGLLEAVRIASAGRGRDDTLEEDGVHAVGGESVQLTRRELDVLAHLSRGCSYAEVAFLLKIGVETVRSHASSLRRKLDVRTRRELIGMPVPLFRKVE